MSSVSTGHRRTLRHSRLCGLARLAFRTHADRPCLMQSATPAKGATAEPAGPLLDPLFRRQLAMPGENGTAENLLISLRVVVHAEAGR